MLMNGKDHCPTFVVKDCFTGTIVNTPGCTYGPRTQRELQLVLLHRGSMQVDVDGTVTELVPGHVILIMPGHQVYIAFDQKEDTWHRWITISTYDIEADVLGAMARFPQVIPISEKMNQLIDILVGLQREDEQGDITVRHTLALGTFQLYAAECQKGAASGVHPAIPLVKSLIQERFDRNLALADLAHAANISPGHLIRLFRQHEATGPKQYLWRYRVERGIELLRTTGLSVGEISELCGFKTSYHFARMVKSYKAHTPTEIRSESWIGKTGSNTKSL